MKYFSAIEEKSVLVHSSRNEATSTTIRNFDSPTFTSVETTTGVSPILQKSTYIPKKNFTSSPTDKLQEDEYQCDCYGK